MTTEAKKEVVDEEREESTGIQGEFKVGAVRRMQAANRLLTSNASAVPGTI